MLNQRTQNNTISHNNHQMYSFGSLCANVLAWVVSLSWQSWFFVLKAHSTGISWKMIQTKAKTNVLLYILCLAILRSISHCFAISFGSVTNPSKIDMFCRIRCVAVFDAHFASYFTLCLLIMWLFDTLSENTMCGKTTFFQ